MKTASIIIVSFDGAPLLKTHLPSLIKAVEYAGSNHEIIIVDNGSLDETLKLLKQDFPQVKVLSLKRNLGFIKATNAAVKEAKGEIIITLNNDMEVDENYLPPLLQHFTKTDVFAVTPKVYFADRHSINAGLKYGKIAHGWFKEIMETEEAKLQTACLTLYAHGGSGAFSKEKFLALGGFDEIYAPFYQEALDLSYRAYKQGWRVIFEPQSVAYHQHRSTVNKLYTAAQIDRVLLRNQLLFFWNNISDSEIMAEHYHYLANKLKQAWQEGDNVFISAFFMAVLKLRQVLRRRQERIPLWICNDREIMALFK